LARTHLIALELEGYAATQRPGLHAKRLGDHSPLIVQRGSGPAPAPVRHGSRRCREGTPGPTPTRIVRVIRHPASCSATHTRANVQLGTRPDSRRAAAARLPHRECLARTTATAGTRGPLVSTPGGFLPLRTETRLLGLKAPVGASTAPRSDRTASAGPHEPPSALRLDVPRETLPARSVP